jgi:DNA replication protein DnaC
LYRTAWLVIKRCIIEIARRDHKKLALRLRRAGFRGEKTLESFDFAFNPSVNQALVMDLATGRFLDEKVPCPAYS